MPASKAEFRLFVLVMASGNVYRAAAFVASPNSLLRGCRPASLFLPSPAARCTLRSWRSFFCTRMTLSEGSMTPLQQQKADFDEAVREADAQRRAYGVSRKDVLQGLNQAQQEAVSSPIGPLLVLAGPGSGKTRVLTHRVGYLLGGGEEPTSILTVTFTNKAANEMRKRIKAMLSVEAPILHRAGPAGDASHKAFAMLVNPDHSFFSTDPATPAPCMIMQPCKCSHQPYIPYPCIPQNARSCYSISDGVHTPTARHKALFNRSTWQCPHKKHSNPQSTNPTPPAD